MKRYYTIVIKYHTGRVLEYRERLTKKKMIKKIVELNMSPHVWYAYCTDVDDVTAKEILKNN